MSTCLAVTKGIAISSLGLYAGLVATGSLLVVDDAVTPTNESKRKIIKALLCKVGAGLGVVSTVMFGLIYASSPSYGRHPYLLYAMLTAPATSLHMYLSKRTLARKLRQLQEKKITDEKHTVATTEEEKAAPDTSKISYAAAAAVGNVDGGELSESVVDLGIEKTMAQAEKDFEVQREQEIVQAETTSLKRRFIAAAVITVVGFTQSALGLSGEVL
ncbi:Autophagy-related protein 33 [Nakaseomyces bracarensis]|uniref:Autophagy-related protein 33 n=1 Tax=Nakaseomyces bracarensis TaxID=273131 RepID=A0ABR4NV50_9SACH